MSRRRSSSIASVASSPSGVPRPSRMDRKIAVLSGSALMQQQKYQSASIFSSFLPWIPSQKGEFAGAPALDDLAPRDAITAQGSPLFGPAEAEEGSLGGGERQQVLDPPLLGGQRSQEGPQVDLVEIGALEHPAARPQVDPRAQCEPIGVEPVRGEKLVIVPRALEMGADR